MPTIDTLVEDINKLFTDKHTPSEENLDIFCNSLKELIKILFLQQEMKKQNNTYVCQI